MSISEVKLPKERTVEEVHQEYSRTCAQAGHLSYQIVTLMEGHDAKIAELTKELDGIQKKLKDLNLEASALIAAKEKKSE